MFFILSQKTQSFLCSIKTKVFSCQKKNVLDWPRKLFETSSLYWSNFIWLFFFFTYLKFVLTELKKPKKKKKKSFLWLHFFCISNGCKLKHFGLGQASIFWLQQQGNLHFFPSPGFTQHYILKSISSLIRICFIWYSNYSFMLNWYCFTNLWIDIVVE